MDFDEIPYDWLEPGTFLEVKPNYRNAGVFAWPEKAMIAGQKLAAGTLAPGQIIEVTRAAEGDVLFGRGSVGAKMVKAFRDANKVTPLYVTALADAEGAVKSTGTFTFVGAASSAVVLRFRIGGRQVRFTALTSDNVTAMATKLAAAINADLDMEVTAASAAGVVTCTARHGGEVGNEIDLRVDTDVQPVPSGLTITVAAMAGGAGNPSVQSVLDLLTNTWITKLVTPWADATNLGLLATWLTARYTAMSKLDCHGFTFKRGTFGELSTFGNLTNYPFLTCGGMKASPTPAYTIAATAMAIASFHLTNDPARQLRSLVLPGVMAPAAADQFTDEEKNLLLNRGISTFDHLSDGTTTISRMITTYKTSNLGAADRAWLDIMVPATASRIRYDWALYVSLLYPRAKLVDDDDVAALVRRDDDDTDPGTAVVTPGRMHASWGARCKLYGEKVWIENVSQKIRESVFQRSTDDRQRLESRQKISIAGNLMVLAGSLEFDA
ncbi:phage tail sheath subtilisin-like domain-containing protein [Rhizobium sp. SL86]|uniref:phage tail sheath subtilisin-like domain-containing protein n=1 Tax=Rhizobium sp. SL86 TaxID=2995148 RepID=UPI0022745F3A|nr:phage tail sheath subtilisin-like domain-containing protein [Rhizobium sp. SL86]MCY1669339.1 phage tail protein [Rhizobium sp. SL86]